MEKFIALGKKIGLGLLDIGEMVGKETIGNIITAIDSFEPLDARLYKSEFADDGELLSDDHGGFCIDGTRSITRKTSHEGVLLTGATGTGKTSVQILNSVLRLQGSQVIHDPAREIFEKTSGYLSRMGFVCFVLNFGLPGCSHRFNPLAYVRTESDINKVCSLLVRTVLGNSANDPFWNLQATMVLKVVVGLVLAFEPEKRNFANVRHLLKAFASNRDSVKMLFVKKADDALFADFKTVLALEPKVFASVVATALAATTLWSDESICQTTSSNSFDFSLLRKEKACVYIQNATADARYYSPLVALFFELLFKEQMSHLPEHDENDVFVILDEAATLYIPLLPLALCNMRKYRTGIFTAWQTYESIINAYGAENAEVIRSNSNTKIYLSGGSQKASEELEKMLGRVEVTHDGKKIVKPLLFSEEIRCLDRSEAVVMSGNKNYKVKLMPYYEQPFIRRRTEMPPAQLACEPAGMIPLIQIPSVPKYDDGTAPYAETKVVNLNNTAS